MPTPNGSPEVAPLRTDLTEITVVGADRTGIVAGVTGLLFERGVNIEDIEQTVRDGVFRMTLHCDTDPVESREALRDELAETGDDLDVDIRTRFPTTSATRVSRCSSRRRTTACARSARPTSPRTYGS